MDLEAECEDVDWTRVVEDKTEVLVNLQVPLRVGNFLIS
jgi:hypothetical protein